MAKTALKKNNKNILLLKARIFRIKLTELERAIVREEREIYSKENRVIKAFKDFFIPRKSNNYKPDILHPKRLFFYGISSIAFKVILVGAIIVFPIEGWLNTNTNRRKSAG